ncbi:MAG: redoxin domain-containing protein [Planctomycetes bacterium]|nr:redoxin domain-containing protein [Planctomycetota bacterium]MBL7007700.1 redoxin domain-containing protein [Planctomycetota bacterium]
MRQFAARYDEFRDAGVEVLRVFPSPLKAMAPYAEGSLRAPFPVLCDPQRRAFDAFGIERRFRGLLSLEGWRRSFAASKLVDKPKWSDMLRDGIRGLPADFLVGADGLIERAHYGQHFSDGLPVNEALDWIGVRHQL